MVPVLYQFGPLPLYSFGLMMVLCFLAAWRMLALQLERDGKDIEPAEAIIFCGAVFGLLGARIFYLLSFPREFLQDPWGSIVSSGGFVFYGGFLGSVVSVIILLKRRNLSVATYADYLAPALCLGYAIGRLGCQLSGDGDYGSASTLPWAISYSLGVIPTAVGERVHPTPVYETLSNLVFALLLLQIHQRRIFKQPGAVFISYLCLTATARFFVEIIRIEPKVLFDLTQAQLESIAVLLAAGLLWVQLRRRSLS